MKRPHLNHFLAIITERRISIRASLSMKEIRSIRRPHPLEKLAPRFPFQSIGMFLTDDFVLKIIGIDESQNEIYNKSFESDSFGNFDLKISINDLRSKITAFQIFETKKFPSLELNMGTFIPLRINSPVKIVISDFDKTLVDTKYSTPKEVMSSLSNPLQNFPTITQSVELIKQDIKNQFHPFILSASPHFYEDAIRDWLYQNEIFTAGIFLKDYRKIFSMFDRALTPTDIKLQGLYKLDHLFNILLMTGIPHELILMGDNVESDPIIYLILAKILLDSSTAREIWNRVKKIEDFHFNPKKDSEFLGRIYQLKSMIFTQSIKPKVTIRIRKKYPDRVIKFPTFLNEYITMIDYYDT